MSRLLIQTGFFFHLSYDTSSSVSPVSSFPPGRPYLPRALCLVSCTNKILSPCLTNAEQTMTIIWLPTQNYRDEIGSERQRELSLPLLTLYNNQLERGPSFKRGGEDLPG